MVSAQVADLLTGDSRQVMARLRERMATLSEQERFEDARTVRDRTLSLVRGAARAQRMDPGAYGRTRRGPPASPRRRLGDRRCPARSPRRVLDLTARSRSDALRRGGTCHRRGGPGPDAPASAATPEETDKILRWLEQPGVRIVDIVGQWTCPVGVPGPRVPNWKHSLSRPSDAIGFAHSA